MEMPEWFPAVLAEARRQDALARIAALPRVKFVLGDRSPYGPWRRAFGVMWDKDPEPEEGAYIYRRRLILNLTFHVSFEHS